VHYLIDEHVTTTIMYQHTQRNFLILAIMVVAGVVPLRVILSLRGDIVSVGPRITIIVARPVIVGREHQRLPHAG
jgi:hypothetical protein